MNVLVIGGSGFLGRTYVQEATARGYQVTTFNRGRSGTDEPGVEAVRGDREVRADLERLVEGRTWDLVIDTSGYVPRVVGESARILSGHAPAYVFVSTISALKGYPDEPINEEEYVLWDCAPDAGPEDGDYGTLKAGCERAVEQEFDGTVLIIQAGLLLGPHENVARLPWWLTRISHGGRVLAPGDPGMPMQLVDVRDVVGFSFDQAEKGVADRFVVTGPAGNATYGELLGWCKAATGSDAEFVWVADDFLAEREVGLFVELPLWLPAAMGSFWTAPTGKAEAAGLRARPMSETVRDAWEWLRHIPEDQRVYGTRMVHGMAPERERELLAAWDARSA
ncbi:NAD-dependent epimerase/dehydratase family protein [Nonomuraea typhae]|uniref:NAD-dependent epimerase/dehydratase family protein n=1 Tax=Nonomuraea typhae TaxID=2603600 RepID=A0ABW7YL52_9ACTN